MNAVDPNVVEKMSKPITEISNSGKTKINIPF